MVEENLTRSLIDAGAKLVSKLDERDLAPDAAFWLCSPDDDTWKLVLVEAKLTNRGPKAGYAKLQNVLARYSAELADIELGDLVLEKPDAQIVTLIKKAIRIKSGIGGVRFRNSVVDGTLIPDAYIYRAA